MHSLLSPDVDEHSQVLVVNELRQGLEIGQFGKGIGCHLRKVKEHTTMGLLGRV